MQSVHDICYIQFCMFSLKHKCLWRGRLWANLASLTHSLHVFVLSYAIYVMTYFHVNPDCPIVFLVIDQVSHSYGSNVSAGNVPEFTISVLAPTM